MERVYCDRQRLCEHIKDSRICNCVDAHPALRVAQH